MPSTQLKNEGDEGERGGGGERGERTLVRNMERPLEYGSKKVHRNCTSVQQILSNESHCTKRGCSTLVRKKNS